MKFKMKTWHWAAIITISVLILLVSAIGIWWNVMDVESFSEGWTLICNLVDPPNNDVRYKESYSVSDKKARKWADKVVATVGGQELTNGELQVYYWMEVYTFLNYNSGYAVSQVLDYTMPLDEQTCPETGGTWQQYFLDMALDSWHEEQAMALMGQNAGLELSLTDKVALEDLRKELSVTASKDNYSSVDAMLQSDMGAGCDYEDYYSYRYVYYWANTWFAARYEQIIDQLSDAQLEAWFQTHKSMLAEQGISKSSGYLYDVRHILIAPEGGTRDEEGNVTYTDKAWEDCQTEAQMILEKWLEVKGDEALFAAYANDYSMDPGSNTSGGLYQDLTADSDVVENFAAWYTEDGRQIGDYGLIKSELGYHIMYLSAKEPQWESAARKALMKDASDDIVADAVEQYPMEVTYKDIVLGVVDLKNME